MKVIRTLISFIAVAVVVSFTSGCKHKVLDTGFLPGGYHHFNKEDQGFLKIRLEDDLQPQAILVAENSGSEIVPVRNDVVNQSPELLSKLEALVGDQLVKQPTVFIISPPKWKTDTAFTEDIGKEDVILFTIRERLYRYLLRNYPEPARVRYAFSEVEQESRNLRVITITSNVTQADRGSGWMRYVIGYGIGMSTIQIEGEIFDGPNMENKIGEYAVRGAHGGFTQNGLNIDVIKDEYALRYSVEEAINALCLELPKYIMGVRFVPASLVPTEIALNAQQEKIDN